MVYMPMGAMGRGGHLGHLTLDRDRRCGLRAPRLTWVARAQGAAQPRGLPRSMETNVQLGSIFRSHPVIECPRPATRWSLLLSDARVVVRSLGAGLFRRWERMGSIAQGGFHLY